MASYEENERQQKRMEAVGENPKLLCHKDVRHPIGHQDQLSCQRPPIKEEAEDPRLCYEEEEDQRPPYIKVEVVEADISKFPQTGVSVKSENCDDNPPERSRCRRSSATQRATAGPDVDPLAGTPPDSLLAPLSDSDDVEGTTSDSDPECSKGDPTFNSKQRSAADRKRRKAKRFRCSVCGQRFLQEKHLTRHARTHTGEILRCSACFKGFLHKHALIKHTKTHTGERAAACSAWAKGFVQKSNTGRAGLAGDAGHEQIFPGDPRVGSPAALESDAERSAAAPPARCERSPSASDHPGVFALDAFPRQPKRPVRLTVEQKKEIIAEHEAGLRVADLAAQFGLPKSTVCTILKNKASIKAADVAKGVTLLTKQRPQILEDVEKLLLLWVNEQELAGGGVSASAVIKKAKRLYGDLVADSGQCDNFKASRGWFDNFIKRSGIRSVRHDEDVDSLNRKAAEAFAGQFESLVQSEGYLPNQVFNCGEAGLFWRKMPKRTSLTKEEKARPGHKPMKDKFTLLLCANASGDCQLKPLLVYHSENPRAFKSNHVLKAELPVMWRANAKIRVTRALFTEWASEVFAPAIKTYLEENALPLRCLLVVDKAAAHPPSLEDDLDAEYNFIRVQFLPSNAARLLQPVGQQLVTHFKKLYTRALFSRCFQVTKATDLTLSQFWRDHFNIFHCIHLIDQAWREVSHLTLQSAWKRLWPTCPPETDSEGPRVAAAAVDDIVSIGTSLGLELDGQDVEELVEEQLEDRRKELSTKELLELQSEQMKSC
ncbi:tigger transposable element-derived protein 1-like [Hippocampus comes]|uniref:tigger transposable element-derived protein 1-like n=1 Tax=Hippocampus comes TaxID=109280 RepID=UPI00094E36CF|nr:PREDICTED: tigger transposable element-derived protein 1-like [Hippocampus comes]